MAATGYTPISLYYSTTASAAPTAGNLVNGELAINITDGKLYYKDNTGTVKVIAGAGGAGIAGGSNTQVQYNSSGSLAGSSNMTFDGTTLTVNGLATTGTVTVGDASGDALTINSSAVSIPNGLNFDSNTFVIDATNNRVGIGLASPTQAIDVQGSVAIRDNYLRILNSGTVTTFVGLGSAVGGTANDTAIRNDTGNILFGFSGSEKMRLDSSGNLGLGVTPSAWYSGAGFKIFQIGSTGALQGGSSNLRLLQNTYYNSGGSPIYLTTGYATEYKQDSGTHVWQTAASGTAGNAITFTQAMTLDSSGRLGIGTSSPTSGYKIDVNGSAYIQGDVVSPTSGTAGGAIKFSGSNSAAQLRLVMNNASATYAGFGTDASGNIILGRANSIDGVTGLSTQVTLSTTGNLGLGVTPSAWGSSARSLDMVGNVGFASLGNTDAFVSANTYYNGTNWIYKASSVPVAMYRVGTSSGSHTWFNAASGTAGGTVSLTTAMTLDASGNLGLGVTPSAWGTYKALQVNTASLWGAGTSNAELGANEYYNGTARAYIVSAAASYYNQSSGIHSWYTAPSGTAGNAITFTQAMTLDASGNLGIGTTSPDSGSRITIDRTSPNQFLMRVGGTDKLSLYADNSISAVDSKTNPLTFYVNSSERMRIDTSGNLLVGTTSNNTGLGTSPKQIIYGSITTDGSGAYPATTALIDDRAYNATSPSPGGAVIFGYKYNTGGSIALGPSIQGFKENSTDGDYASGIKFATRANGASPTERMRIGSAGQIGIGGANYGTAGQVLTSNGASAAPSWQTVSGGGGGGTTVSSAVDVTLTNTSTQIQYVSMTATDKYVILPDATTLQKGDTKFTIINSGNNLFGIKNSAGNIIVPVVAGSQTVTLNLQENATAAGKWSDQVGTKRLSVGLPQVSSVLATNGSNQSSQIAVLSATQALIFYMTSTTAINVVLATISGTTVTYGTPVSVVTGLAASNNYMQAKTYSSSQAVLTYHNASNTYIVAVSVSGSTVTVGTPTSLTATAVAGYTSGKLEMIDTTTGVVGYATGSTTSVMQAFTVSGTTVTTGTAVSLAADSQIYGISQISNGKVLVTYREGSGIVKLRVYTNSGTTLTAGTAFTCNSQEQSLVANYGLIKTYTDTAGAVGYQYGGVVNVSGTTVSSFNTFNNVNSPGVYSLFYNTKYLSDGLQVSVQLFAPATVAVSLLNSSSTQYAGGVASTYSSVYSGPSTSFNNFDVISSTKFILVSTEDGYVTTQIFEVLY